MDFNDKIILITGASSGIGAACALKFAKASARLSLVGRNIENLESVISQCEEISSFKPHSIIADLSIDHDVERIVNETIERYGRLDVLINNAGITQFAGVQNGIAAYDDIMGTNLRGTYLLTSKIIPHLIETKGNIVNISSILSSKPNPVMTPYCMSKAALDMFTKCVSIEMGPKGVRVNSVNPGPVRTGFFGRAGMNADEDKLLFDSIEKVTPLRKLTEADDVAEIVAFLSSDKASCITGSCFIIDCGLNIGDIQNH